MLSRSAEYAIRALSRLASGDTDAYVQVRDIAEPLGLPPHFLAKILATLTAEGLLKSQRGRKGGFRLARPPSEISLLEVVEPLDHLSRRRRCLLGVPDCSAPGTCPLHQGWESILADFVDLLASTTLAATASKPSRRRSGRCHRRPRG